MQQGLLLYLLLKDKKIERMRRMILVNTDAIAGKEVIETLGLVKGSTIRAKHIGKDIISAFRHIVGGELKEYKDMMDEARKMATAEMVREAEALGADAIIGIRFTSASIMQGAAEIMAYGTAVKVKDI